MKKQLEPNLSENYYLLLLMVEEQISLITQKDVQSSKY